jgi:hypothetical protein
MSKISTCDSLIQKGFRSGFIAIGTVLINDTPKLINSSVVVEPFSIIVGFIHPTRSKQRLFCSGGDALGEV